MDKIIVKGARVHNLKNIDCEIPKNKLVVFTGLSGSGKSSLAFDTIYAEGQRRYVESLSAYARQFLGIMDKPDVDSIEGLSPAISIDQKSTSHNPRSTVGTVTEIYDYLRLLFARIGHPHCPNCGREISQQSVDQIIANLIRIIEADLTTKKQSRLLILTPVIRDRKGEFTQLFANLRSKGYNKARIDNQIYNLSSELLLLKNNKHTIEVVIDQISVDKNLLRNEIALANLKSRLNQDLESGLKLSDGLIIISEVQDTSLSFPDNPKDFTDHLFSEHFSCPVCNLSLPPIEPRTFSFNSPYGACGICTGLGMLLKVDADLVLNLNLSISEGGIMPFPRSLEHETWQSRLLAVVCKEFQINQREPINKLNQKQKEILLNGTGQKIYEVQGFNRFGKETTIYQNYEGVVKTLERRYKETDSSFVRLEIEKYMRKEICLTCNGSRLKKEALGITINDCSIVAIAQLSIKDSLAWISKLSAGLSPREKMIADLILREITNRLQFLLDVGLDYLTLDRSSQSLAGGEGQRIRLASQIGSGLSGVLYVLDEPSIGLHQKDNRQLINSLSHLRNLGNTVIVVEHDREMIEAADYVFDFGPKAGEGGGQIIASGTVEQIKNNRKSLTGDYLSGRRKIDVRSETWEAGNRDVLFISGASHFNLKNLDVSFPLGKLICVTGVSGSGKSTLVVETLYKALKLQKDPYFKEVPGNFLKLEGGENLDKIILIDQSPIGRTPRSNPATYTGAFSYIRDLFSQTREAKIRGFKPGRFSFNVRGGRCEACEGEGEMKIEMQFLPDIYVTCEVCNGKRYNFETLEVTFKGKNIAQVLEMTVAEALEFFQNIPGLYEKLKTLMEVGLSYLHLGQPAPTLSGGEAQRVKLASELAKRATGKTLYLLDEPTTGLHFADLEKLLVILRKLVAFGNTVIVIEHNLDLIKNADHIIDLGPNGGDKGGYLVAQGSPKEVSKIKNSYTGQFLAKILSS